MGWCGFSTNGIIALVRALQLGNVSTPVETTQLNQALSRGFIQEMGDGSVIIHKKKHQTFAILFLKLIWETLLKSFFVVFSSGEKNTCPNLFRPLTWKRSYISDFSNQSRLQEFDFLLQHPIHPWVKATLLDALQLWRDQRADVREASWRNTSPMQTWGTCELCCLESLYHLILEGEVCVCISWLYLVSHYVCRCIYIYIVCLRILMQSAPKLQFGNIRSWVLFAPTFIHFEVNRSEQMLRYHESRPLHDWSKTLQTY